MNMIPDPFQITSGDKKLLNRLAPLWELLKKHHVSSSLHFPDQLQLCEFEPRVEYLSGKSLVMVEIISDNISNEDVGYCISSIDNENVGAIETIFIKDSYRSNKLGDILMQRSLDWLDLHYVKKKVLSVIIGNEDVLKFYQKFGFYPRTVSLCQK